MPRKVSDGWPCKRGGRRVEVCAKPETLVGERFGDGHVVEAEVGVGVDAARDERGEHGAGDDGGVPVRVVEAGRGDARTLC